MPRLEMKAHMAEVHMAEGHLLMTLAVGLLLWLWTLKH